MISVGLNWEESKVKRVRFKPRSQVWVRFIKRLIQIDWLKWFERVDLSWLRWSSAWWSIEFRGPQPSNLTQSPKTRKPTRFYVNSFFFKNLNLFLSGLYLNPQIIYLQNNNHRISFLLNSSHWPTKPFYQRLNKIGHPAWWCFGFIWFCFP